MLDEGDVLEDGETEGETEGETDELGTAPTTGISPSSAAIPSIKNPLSER